MIHYNTNIIITHFGSYMNATMDYGRHNTKAFYISPFFIPYKNETGKNIEIKIPLIITDNFRNNPSILLAIS